MSRQGPRDQKFTSGAAHVYTEGGAGVGQSYNREDATCTTTPEKFTWPVGARPTKITVNAHTPGTNDVVLYVCFDAPDAATAATWLAGAAGEATDSQRFIVFPVDLGNIATGTNNSGFPKEFSFTSGLSNMYYKTSASTCVILVEAS